MIHTPVYYAFICRALNLLGLECKHKGTYQIMTNINQVTNQIMANIIGKTTKLSYMYTNYTEHLLYKNIKKKP